MLEIVKYFVQGTALSASSASGMGEAKQIQDPSRDLLTKSIYTPTFVAKGVGNKDTTNAATEWRSNRKFRTTICLLSGNILLLGFGNVVLFFRKRSAEKDYCAKTRTITVAFDRYILLLINSFSVICYFRFIFMLLQRRTNALSKIKAVRARTTPPNACQIVI